MPFLHAPTGFKQDHQIKQGWVLGMVKEGIKSFSDSQPAAGVNPVVISGIVGHKKVEMAAEVYDRASSSDIKAALGFMGNQLLPQLLPGDSVQ
jgi:hypothetical protein